MAQTVTANNIRINDVITVRNNSDFLRRDARTTCAVVREIILDPADNKTVKRLVVFEILPDDQKLPSRRQYAPLKTENARLYGFGQYDRLLAVIDPVAVDIDVDHYYLNRRGVLNHDDMLAIHTKIAELGGEDRVNMGGIGPLGYSQADWNKFVGPGFQRRIEDEEKPERDPAKPVRAYRKKGIANMGVVVDLPLEFAGKVTDLDPRIIDGLKDYGIKNMREAKDLADAGTLALLIPSDDPGAMAEINIDKAITDGYLAANTPGLTLVMTPIGNAKPVTTLNELFNMAQDDGAGLNGYVGLASKTGKMRQGLIQNTLQAWNLYRVASPETDAKNNIAAQKIKSAWTKLMDEYVKQVRPHIKDLESGGVIISPEKIPEKFMEEGKLVFTFPKITGPQ